VISVVALCVAAIAGGVIYFCFDPALSRWFPKCPFLLATGLKCPGCGSQRAIHGLLHLDLPAAFSQNALLVCSLPYLFLLTAARITQFFSPRSMFPVHIQRPVIIRSYFASVILFWTLRNIFGF
jgi:hypothetical protein